MTWADHPLHVIVVVGSNYEFGRHLEKAFLTKEQRGHHAFYRGKNSNVTVEVAKDPHMDSASQDVKHSYYLQADELVNLMDISDVLLTKPGGSTTAEAAFRGLPTLFDATK